MVLKIMKLSTLMYLRSADAVGGTELRASQRTATYPNCTMLNQLPYASQELRHLLFPIIRRTANIVSDLSYEKPSFQCVWSGTSGYEICGGRKKYCEDWRKDHDHAHLTTFGEVLAASPDLAAHFSDQARKRRRPLEIASSTIPEAATTATITAIVNRVAGQPLYAVPSEGPRLLLKTWLLLARSWMMVLR
jgi:hypothetical protein